MKKEKVEINNTTRIETILDWQQQRLQHLKSLSRGTFALSVAILVAAVTIHSSLTNSNYSIISIANSVSDSPTISAFVGFSLLASTGVALITFTSYLICLSKLAEVVLADDIGISVIPDEVSIKPSVSDDISSRLSYQDYLVNKASESTSLIKDCERRYDAGATRLVTAFYLGFLSYQMFSEAKAGAYQNLLMYNIIIVLPVISNGLIRSVLSVIMKPVDSASADQSDSLINRIGSEKGGSWEQRIGLRISEYAIFKLVVGLSLLATASYLLHVL